MRIYNFKVNKAQLAKILLFVFILICLVILIFSFSNLFTKVKNYKTEEFTINDAILSSDSNEISSSHDYIGKEITFTGYVYKIDYLQKNQFVIARNMIINEASQTVVVGFLCEYDKISNFENLSWVKLTGTIKEGDLNGKIPVLEITQIEKASKPDDEFVYPPEDTYVPTSNIY